MATPSGSLDPLSNQPRVSRASGTRASLAPGDVSSVKTFRWKMNREPPCLPQPLPLPCHPHPKPAAFLVPAAHRHPLPLKPLALKPPAPSIRQQPKAAPAGRRFAKACGASTGTCEGGWAGDATGWGRVCQVKSGRAKKWTKVTGSAVWLASVCLGWSFWSGEILEPLPRSNQEAIEKLVAPFNMEAPMGPGAMEGARGLE